MVAAPAKEARLEVRRELLQTARGRNNYYQSDNQSDENNNITIMCPVWQYPCSHVAGLLKGEFRHIARICASCSLCQMVYVVLPV